VHVCGARGAVKARPPETDLASVLATRRFPLVRADYVSKGRLRFPESIPAAVYDPACRDCGICHDYRDFSECDGTNHVTDRGPCRLLGPARLQGGRAA
jgi:hypothetical protein